MASSLKRSTKQETEYLLGYLIIEDEADLPDAKIALVSQCREAAGLPDAPYRYHMMYIPEEEHFEMAVAIELGTTGRGRD